MKLSAVAAALAIAGGLGFSGQALADALGTITDVTMSFPDATRTHTIDMDPGFNGYAGLASGSETNADWDFLPGVGDNGFAAWCLEPMEYLQSPATYDVNTLEDAPQQGSGLTMGSRNGVAGSTRADDMRRLFGGVYDFATDTFSDVTVAGLSDRDLRTAFQVAIWEIANETDDAGAAGYSYDVTSGGFKRGSGGGDNWTNVASQANTWLGNLESYGAETGLLALVNTTNNKQDFIVKVVPIPAAAWLFGSALIGTIAIGRRKTKAKAQTVA